MYEAGAYPAAIRAYEKGLQKTENLESRERLADAYWQVREMEKAEAAFKYLVTADSARPEHYLRYAQALQYNSKYKEANEYLDEFSNLMLTLRTLYRYKKFHM